MSDKPKTRAEEIAYDVGVKDGRRGQDKCPYIIEPFAHYWRDGYAEATGEMKSGGATTEWNQMQRRAKQKQNVR